jgi:hypothetical protein
MKVKTSDLDGAQLDWAVAKCESGDEFLFNPDPYTPDENGQPAYFEPSTDWSQGGPIIEREGISIERDDQGLWFASYDLSVDTAWGATGPTPLIAAMRCYVASKLGEEIEILMELESCV